MLSKRNRRHRISPSQPPPRPRETLCHNHTHTHGHKHKTQTHSNSRSNSHSHSHSHSHMQPPHRRHGQRKANATRAGERVVRLPEREAKRDSAERHDARQDQREDDLCRGGGAVSVLNGLSLQVACGGVGRRGGAVARVRAESARLQILRGPEGGWMQRYLIVHMQ
jgi:hypothetical protein